MNNIIPSYTMGQARGLDVVAGEIRAIKQQTLKLILDASIEIGRRLVEAKALVEHGAWGTWLKEEVEFSHSTANNLMKLFEEYGDDQSTMFGAVLKSQTFGILSYSKALALLAIEGEDRETFAKEVDAKELSTRELEEKIKAYKEQIEGLKKEAAATPIIDLDVAIKERVTEAELKVIEAQAQARQAQRDLDKLKATTITEEDVKGAVEAAVEEKEEEIKELEETIEQETTKREKEIERLETELKTEKAKKQKEIDDVKEKYKNDKDAQERQIESRKKDFEEKVKMLEEKLQNAQHTKLIVDDTKIKFKLLVEELQRSFNIALEIANTEQDIEQGKRYKNALQVILGSLIEKI